MNERVEEDARLDELRRRLYHPDATDEDRQRYLDERGAMPDEPPATNAAPRPSRRGRRFGIAAAAVLVGVALVDGVVLAQPEERAASRPVATPAMVADIGDGRQLTIDGDASGPTPVATSIRGTAVVGQSYQGYGSAVVAFDPGEGAFDGGRALVEVRSTDPTAVTWRAIILLTRQDWTSYPMVAAHGEAQERSGAHAPTTFVYPGRPPTRVAIQAPEGVGWTLVVATTGLVTPRPPLSVPLGTTWGQSSVALPTTRGR